MKTNVSKLSVKVKNYSPRGASPAPSSENDGLNRAETLSDHRIVLADNLGEENQPEREQGLRVPVKVYVLNMRGQPLMPTTARKARLLLAQSGAKVVTRTPFTIQLNYPTGEAKQPIILGINPGYSKVGFSAVTEKEELISGEVSLYMDMSKRLQEKAMYRTGRRSKLWYRKPRWENRQAKQNKRKKQGKKWFAPSIQHKLDTNIRLIEKIKTILPITETIVEVAKFDTQKMQKPEIKGIQYQQGELYGYEVREYLLEKWGRKCAYCKKKNIPIEIEHIVPKSRGGSNRVSNLTISCHECNQKKGNRTAEEFGYKRIQAQAKKSLRATPFMNYVRYEIVNKLRCKSTYGYITKHDRIKLDLSKSKVNDAFIIANGKTQHRVRPFAVTQVRRNNRSLQTNYVNSSNIKVKDAKKRGVIKRSTRKMKQGGRRKKHRKTIDKTRRKCRSNPRTVRYKNQPNDLIRYEGELYRTGGVHNYGKNTRLKINGKYKSVTTKKTELVTYGKGLSFDLI